MHSPVEQGVVQLMFVQATLLYHFALMFLEKGNLCNMLCAALTPKWRQPKLDTAQSLQAMGLYAWPSLVNINYREIIMKLGLRPLHQHRAELSSGASQGYNRHLRNALTTNASHPSRKSLKQIISPPALQP